MKTNKKSLKSKAFAGLGVALATSPLISLVGCGKNENVNNRVGSEYDKEYGVNEAVHKKLKADFRNQVIASLVNPSPEDLLEANKDLDTVFAKFDAQYNEQNLSYTALTNSMIEFASRVYNIRLQRQTVTKTAKWEDIEVEFKGMQKSFYEYMWKAGISQELREKMMADSTEQFRGNPDKGIEGLITTIKRKYDDPLMGLITAKSKLLSCFASVNEEIALVSASIRLNEFFDNHEITYDVTTADDASNKFDNIKNAGLLVKDADFSEHILDVFTIFDKQNKRKLTEFKPDKICPGFVVKPILKDWYENPLTNTYQLKIDWTCVSEIYYQTHDEEKIANTTAHLFNKRNDKYDIDNIEDFNVQDYFKEIRQSSGVEYNVILSNEGERKTIKETYLNPVEKHLAFDWFEKDASINAFDAFFYGERLDDGQTTTREYLVDFSSLAMSGLSVATTNNKTNADNFIRFDKIMSTGTAKEDEKENDYDDLIRNFVDNCVVSSISEANASNDDNEVTSTLFIKYRNSTYDFDKEKETKVTEPVTRNCFTLSQNAYDFLTTKYNEQMDLTGMYTDEEVREEYENVKDDVIVQSVFFGINVLFTAWLSFMCIVPIFAGHMPIYVVLMVLTWISMGAQCTLIGLLIGKKYKPLKEFTNNAKKLLHKKEVTDFVDAINALGTNYSLCRYDKEDHYIYREDYDAGFAKFTVRKNFVAEILPAMESLQNINQMDEYNLFMAAINASGASPQDYESKMHVWGKNGWCQITTISLTFISLGLDIICIGLMFKCPECTNWALMKQARAMAGYQGGYKSVIQTYQNLQKAKKFMDMAKKLGYTPRFTFDDLAKLTTDELEKFVKFLDPKTGKLIKTANPADLGEFLESSIWVKLTESYRWNEMDVETGLVNLFDGIEDGSFGFAKGVKAITSGMARTPGKVIESASGATAFYLDSYLEALDRTFSGLRPFEAMPGAMGNSFEEFQQLIMKNIISSGKFPMLEQEFKEIHSIIKLAKASLRANPSDLTLVWRAFENLDIFYQHIITAEGLLREIKAAGVEALRLFLRTSLEWLMVYWEKAKSLLKTAGVWKVVTK